MSLSAAPQKTKTGSKQTPMMQQWEALKAQAGDNLLFFRLGDFFELFGEDAIQAAPIMGVTLTSRNTKSSHGNSQALCGVPIGNFEPYLHKLLDAGRAVALAEQTEEAGPGKNLVRREIVQYFTPGIRLLHQDERAHYCAVVTGRENCWVLAAADVATGHVVLERGNNLEVLEDIIERLPIEDLRIPQGENFNLVRVYEKPCQFLSDAKARQLVMEDLGIVDWQDSPCQSHLETQCLGSLFSVLHKAHPGTRLSFVKPQLEKDSLWISSSTSRNLHLFEPQKQSLFDFLNQTKTALGRRELKNMLAHPSTRLEIISARQRLVRSFKTQNAKRRDFRQRLSQVQDIQRLLRKKPSPRGLWQLSKSLSAGLEAAHLISGEEEIILQFQKTSLQLGALYNRLDQSLQWSELPETGWIQEGVSAELDELRHLQLNASKFLADLEEKLRAETKVSSLKIKFHQVFGYVAEVTSLHKSKIPETAKHIQTLANSERFKTLELEELEKQILSLKTRISEAEKAEYQKLYQAVDEHQKLLQDWGGWVAKLDCFQALAEVSERYCWNTPITQVSEDKILDLEEASHPLSLENFVPLNFSLSSDELQVILLTGPNMAGKSTILRVAALIALLHQIGSDVPARRAVLSIVDRIMCRMGAQDDMTHGKSTFFVEMKEVATMLQGATAASLLLFDEVGRGTSTYDGMSLAWAITEAVHDLGSLSIVATHYLELAQLEKSLLHLKNFHVGVKEIEGQLVFTRKLMKGPASQSYGIQVARLAKIPEEILERAENKLKEFEKKRTKPPPLFDFIQNDNA